MTFKWSLSHTNVWSLSIPVSGNSSYIGPEAGVCLVCSWSIKEASVFGQGNTKERVVGYEIGKGMGAKSCGPLLRILDFTLNNVGSHWNVLR